MSRILVAAAVLVFAGTAQAAGNAEAGKARAAQVCAACHGAQGNKPTAPENPILAGQHQDYITHVLNHYKNGKRKNPIMQAQVKDLKQKDLMDLAAYFASQHALKVKH